MYSHRSLPVSAFISGVFCHSDYCACKDDTPLQPHHPLDTINRVLLEKVRMVKVQYPSILNLWLESWGSGSRYA